MQVIEIEPKPRLKPVFEMLKKFGYDYLYRLVDDKNLKKIISNGTDRTSPKHRFRWYDEEEIIKCYGINKNEFTFARPLKDMIAMIHESAKFDIGIYKGGFLILVYKANQMHELDRDAYLFLKKPKECLEAVIKVKDRDNKYN